MDLRENSAGVCIGPGLDSSDDGICFVTGDGDGITFNRNGISLPVGVIALDLNAEPIL